MVTNLLPYGYPVVIASLVENLAPPLSYLGTLIEK